jgi:cellobiose-specific phosphotransferase system component IIC
MINGERVMDAIMNGIIFYLVLMIIGTVFVYARCIHLLSSSRSFYFRSLSSSIIS